MESPFNPLRCFTMSVLDSVRKIIPNDPCSTAIIARDIEKLQRSLMWIKATLAEAEYREIKDESLKLWIRELREIAYDSEDIMEEYNYEILRSEVEHGKLSTSKRKYDETIKEGENSDDDESMSNLDFIMQDIRGVILSGGMEESYDDSKSVHIGKWKHNDEVSTEKTCHFSSIEICHLTKNIRELRRKFNEITWFRKALGLRPEDGSRVPEASSKHPTSGFLNEQNMVGRELDKKGIVEMLLSDNNASDVNISVIPMVGMAGLGKITLSQLVYNDQMVVSHFKLRMWVHVSENLDLIRITNALIESITRERSRLVELDPLQRELSEKLEGVSFMLVLDDVWNENPELWMSLRASLCSCAKGSKILVTTRSQQVANIMRTGPTYNMRYLSDDQCWSLLSRNAFEGLNQSDNQNLVDIGRRIAAKCKGLPLTVRVLSEFAK
ncbi:hypothetical protein LUZ60_006295 [Juncus effusus]|nr:hypothetical protein LUZ60_006295 [Juncus effusus]